MQDLFNSLVHKVQTQSGSYANLDLVQGLDAAAIATLEATLGVTFPEDFVAGLQFYGKTVPHPTYKGYIISIPHYGEMGLVSEQQLLAVYQLLQASDYQRTIEHACPEIGTALFWHPQWIPIAAYANGNIHTSLSLYDLLILEEGSPLYGQVVYWSHREGAIRVVAPSYQEYIDKFHRDLDYMGWNETYGFSF